MILLEIVYLYQLDLNFCQKKSHAMYLDQGHKNRNANPPKPVKSFIAKRSKVSRFDEVTRVTKRVKCTRTVYRLRTQEWVMSDT